MEILEATSAQQPVQFTIPFPLDEVIPSIENLTAPPRQSSDVHNMHIMIINDSPENIELLQVILQRSRFTNTSSALSGEKTLEHLNNHTEKEQCAIDLILLDTMMPRQEGYQVCNALKKREAWKDIPVIIITAANMWPDEIANNGINAGAIDVIFKPVHRRELAPRLMSTLTLKKERDLRKHREQELKSEFEERRDIEERLKFVTGHDHLTGLNNRQHLEESLTHSIHSCRKDSTTHALLYLNLEQFKVINDTEGYGTGNQILIRIANVLKKRLGATSKELSRVGPDEFTALIENTSKQEVSDIAKSLYQEITEISVKHHEQRYKIVARIGIAFIQPWSTSNPGNILSRAEQACCVARKSTPEKIHIYSEKDSQIAEFKSTNYWIPIIKNALEKNQFQLFFQPVLDVKNNEVTRYEALIRLRDNSGKFISPDNFIPIAERMGLIHDIDLWVVENAFNTLNSLPKRCLPISLNINLSTHSFTNPSLVPLVQFKLQQTGINPERITFEITETAAINNFEKSQEMFNHLRALGCKFALDDFGAGFNSFSYLKHFDVDCLKIDGAFITNLINNPVDQTLVRAIIEIAKTLNKSTVAEFVTDQETFELLKEYGIDYIQGYYTGKPQPSIL
ncbi:MAG: EAL domain-containing protein [Gammaproteobacteria bacterium]|nr:EAL domain-containing protein [Gammaproteobacteria bacterium]